jgi:hypothetical protein
MSLAAPFSDSHFRRTTKPKFSAPNNPVGLIEGWVVTPHFAGGDSFGPTPACRLLSLGAMEANRAPPAVILTWIREPIKAHPRFQSSIAEEIVMKKAPGFNRHRILRSGSGYRCR